MATRNKKIMVVSGGIAYKCEGGPILCRVATSAKPRTGWYDLLERPGTRTFSFRGRNGSMTVVGEYRKRGRCRYWYGIRKIDGTRHKRYIGKTTALTLDRLEHIAAELENVVGQLEQLPLPVAVQ